MADKDPLDLVERRYSWPWWVFLREARNANGFDAASSADAIAIGMYRSRGQLVIGFEKKVSRADWLRELKNPEKAEHVAKFCDQWYIVVPEEGIVDISELPPTWGLLLSRGKKLRTIKVSEGIAPLPISRSFLAALLKQGIESATEPYQKNKEEIESDRLREEFERGRNCAGMEIDRLKRIEKQAEDFEKASGVRISDYRGGKKLGEAVNAVLSMDEVAIRVKRDSRRYAEQIENQAQQMRRFSEAFEGPPLA